MPSITLKDLSEQIDIQEIHNKTRKDFENEQRKRRSINDWIISLMPAFVLIAALVFYALSAPHTAGLLEWITPGWGWLSPAGFEFFIVVIGAVHQLGWKTKETVFMLYGLMTAAVIINVFGGVLSVITQAAQLKGLTVIGLIENFYILEAKWQIVLILAIIIGVLIPVAGKFAGSFVIKLARGEIKFQIVSIEDLWLKERAFRLKSAFMKACMEMGAGPKTAGAWSERVIGEMFDFEEISAVGQGLDLSQSVPGPVISEKSERPMGFAANISARMDSQESQDTRTRFSIRAADVVKWVEENDEKVREMLKRPDNRRTISKEISRKIIGVETGYKTIERVLKAKGYDF